MHGVIAFFVDNLPSPIMVAIGGPVSLVWAYLSLYLAGYLKQVRGLKTGYTRKVFHLFIFCTVAAVHTLWGVPGVFCFGGMTTLVIFYAVLRGEGHHLYEAMAREKDAPRRTTYIVVPYLATFVGGVTSNVLFGHLAIFGYLVTGIGDAAGEPVGVRFGRHPYRVPDIGGVPSTRTLEGSAAVLAGCIIAFVLGAWSCPDTILQISSLYTIPLLGLACTLMEAICPRGLDNAVLQIVPTWMARWL